ncbi:imidazole glycerol phosphate synthase subunit HisH [Sphingobacterium paucimobilis]|uniref:Imidazole glycerol phosphate synthase subunit HisH n=1 Tax=Sphingobacterium paucimobilis HER1398 TaxID=1346330 RepID=U2HQH4_9SPHI|nr:imidazole glycerol phosphate synthase subunit HisH [Sphingobacterium paucimobilis]ERJ57722.1 hypothetical protein M472_02980 [Sphingobacterium paucimobilis HER1398]
MISVIDYGLGNLGSVCNMFKKVGYEAMIITSPEDLNKATKIILPGVGAFDTGMKNLNEGQWIKALNKRVLEDKIPTLGICLGMQLMCRSSEEGSLSGLGWINGRTKKFHFENKDLKSPHMGWNNCLPQKESSLIIDDFEVRRYYFVHSYFVEMTSASDILFTTVYDKEFTSAFEVDNIIGVQFHPEKSHKFGLSLFKNFAERY